MGYKITFNKVQRGKGVKEKPAPLRSSRRIFVDRIKLNETIVTSPKLQTPIMQPAPTILSPKLSPTETVTSPVSPLKKRPNDLEEKAEISSSLIAQHFSILRELHQYCMLLKENVGPDVLSLNPDDVWRNFNHLVELLEAGCDYLNYPIKV